MTHQASQETGYVFRSTTTLFPKHGAFASNALTRLPVRTNSVAPFLPAYLISGTIVTLLQQLETDKGKLFQNPLVHPRYARTTGAGMLPPF